MGHAFVLPLTNEYVGHGSVFLFGIRSFLYKRPGPVESGHGKSSLASVVGDRPALPSFRRRRQAAISH
jgi:hypothetical protein